MYEIQGEYTISVTCILDCDVCLEEATVADSKQHSHHPKSYVHNAQDSLAAKTFPCTTPNPVYIVSTVPNHHSITYIEDNPVYDTQHHAELDHNITNKAETGSKANLQRILKQNQPLSPTSYYDYAVEDRQLLLTAKHMQCSFTSLLVSLR